MLCKLNPCERDILRKQTSNISQPSGHIAMDLRKFSFHRLRTVRQKLIGNLAQSFFSFTNGIQKEPRCPILRHGIGQPSEFRLKLRPSLSRSGKTVRKVQELHVELAPEFLKSEVYDLRSQHSVLQSGQEPFFDPFLVFLQIIGARPTVEILWAAVFRFSARASTGHNRQVGPALSALEKTRQQVGTRCRTREEASPAVVSEHLTYSLDARLDFLPQFKRNNA
jgi:hypothetical protein